VSDLMVGPGTPSDAGFEIFSNGILVPPNRVEILTAALRYLIAAPEIRWSMGHAGQAFARERFSIDRLASDMATLYGRLIGFAPDRSTSLERTSLTS